MNLLDGIKIIDFTRLLPGPLATNLLAQMGAEVIKVESPKRMDYVRSTGPPVDGASVLFHQLNHNKKSLVIDYSSEAGKKELLELIKTADALVEQFRPGAMDAWGLGYEQVKAIHPNIVYLSLTGYGQDNPYSNEAGHDFNYLAYSGLMSLLKDEQGKPTVSGTQWSDISGAYMTVMALQSALLRKSKTGEGAFVDVSLSDAVMPFLHLPWALHQGGMDHRQFNIINGKTTVNYASYECADGKWLSVAAMELKFWNQLAALVGKPEWQREHALDLLATVFPKAEVEVHFKTRSRDEWVALCKDHDVCVAPILEIEELEQSDFHQSKHTFETFETEKGTEMKTFSLPFKVR